MRAVNLLPRDTERQGKDGRGKAPLFAAAGGIAAVTVGAVVVFMSASGSVSDQRAQLDSVESAIARVRDVGHPTVASGAIAQARADRVAALSAALTTRVPLDRLLRELAYVLPDDAWLTGLSAAAPESARVGGCSSVVTPMTWTPVFVDGWLMCQNMKPPNRSPPSRATSMMTPIWLSCEGSSQRARPERIIRENLGQKPCQRRAPRTSQEAVCRRLVAACSTCSSRSARSNGFWITPSARRASLPIMSMA